MYLELECPFSLSHRAMANSKDPRLRILRAGGTISSRRPTVSQSLQVDVLVSTFCTSGGTTYISAKRGSAFIFETLGRSNGSSRNTFKFGFKRQGFSIKLK